MGEEIHPAHWRNKEPAKSIWDLVQLDINEPLEADDPRFVDLRSARGEFRFDEPFRRLQRVLPATPRFRLVILQFATPEERDQRVRWLGEKLSGSEILDVPGEWAGDFATFRTQLEARAAAGRAVQVVGCEGWLRGSNGLEFARAFNLYRETLAERCPVPVLIWLSEPAIRASGSRRS